jgi:hypothetical protein
MHESIGDKGEDEGAVFHLMKVTENKELQSSLF